MLLAYLPNDAADLLGGEQKQQLGSAERKQAPPAPTASQVQNAAFRGKTNSWTPFSAALTSRSRSFFPNPPLLFLLMRCAFKALPRSSRAARAPAGCQGAHSSHRWLMAATRQWGGDEGALPSLGWIWGGETTRTFPCMSSRMVSVTFNPPSMTPVSILGCVGSGQALSAVRSLVAG